MAYPKKVRLKSGDELLLRPAVQADEKSLIGFFAAIPEADRMHLKEDVTDAATVKRWMANVDYGRVFPLLAFSGDELIGDATLHLTPFGWSRHVGEIRVVVAAKWQRKGIGQALLRELVAAAIDRGVEILEAQILEGDDAAQHAFTSLGFSVETLLKNRAVDRTGRKRNVLVMTNDVSELWQRMEDIILDLEYTPDAY